MTEIATILRQEVDREGVISFARFMEIALYCPKFGYYEQPHRIGKRGDFYTSVSVGKLFGELLSFRFSKWLEESYTSEGNQTIVEAGAHDGQLAADVLTELRSFNPRLFERTSYCLIEPSDTRQKWQRDTLADFADRVRWVRELSEIPPRSLNGLIFLNELLDAFPVHRIAWDAGQKSWFEWGVAWETQRFVWRPLHRDRDWRSEITAAGFPLSPDLESILPDGYILELCPSAVAWWHNASEALAAGHLITIDYGFNAEELLRPERCNGTLRAYSHHRSSSDLLSRPSEQDLTAHVNFTSIIRSGERDGFKTLFYASQERFLTSIAMDLFRERENARSTLAGTTSQLKTLTDPSSLGRLFRVLVQRRLPAQD